MRQKKVRFFPDPGEYFIQIVWRRRAFSGLNVEFRRNIMQQAIFGIVN